jgi:hypothetical protein
MIAIVSGTGVEQEPVPSWREKFRAADELPVSASASEKRSRGRQFERILHSMLAEASMAPRTSYRPRGEEIDGSFVHNLRTMLLEAKWTHDPIPASSIYQFRGKIEGKLVGTIGVFLSIGGFSADAIDALIAGKVVNTILFDGDDVRAIVADQFSIGEALDRKLRAAADSGTPFLPLRDESTRQPTAPSTPDESHSFRVVIVEGRFDALLVHALADELGPPADQIQVLPAGGPFNLAALANLAHTAGQGNSVTIIADGDGDREAVQRFIEAGLDDFAADAPQNTRVLVLDPTFEEAIGVLEGFAVGRKRVLSLDGRLLRDKVRDANVREVAERNQQVKELLDALGLGVKINR